MIFLYNRIDYNGPNNVTYYCQHRDTDSGDAHTLDQSSDEEWTFERTQKPTKPVPLQKTQSETKLQPKQLQYPSRIQNLNPKLSKQELRRLVHQAEKLVSTPVKVRKPIIEEGKFRRVKEWLNHSNTDVSDLKVGRGQGCLVKGF